MDRWTRIHSAAVHRTLAFALVCAIAVAAMPAGAHHEAPISSAAAAGAVDVASGHGDLEPRYQPAPAEPEPAYETSYLFATTRAVADSTLVPAAKLPLYVLTVPVDVALLPFAVVAGIFG